MFPPNQTYLSRCFSHTCLLAVLFLITAVPCRADLRTAPAWFDTGIAGSPPDWHYRVPISIPSAAANSTVRIDVDFDALLSDLGIVGTFDGASPRVVRSNGTLVDVQQFTDAVYMGATDAVGNGRGEVRFIYPDSGADTYYLYFDITQNGIKPAWPTADTINGNFEFGAAGDRNIAGWTVTAGAGFDAELRPDENPSINSDTTGADTPFVTTDGSPYSGRFAYLMGARSQNEPGNGFPAVTLTRDIDLGASPGELNLRYRVEGWDSSADGAGQYDFIRIRLIGSTTVELVGPGAGNYGQLPFSPNYGTQPVSGSQSGYGRYNGWDTDTGGGRHYTPPMTWAVGSQPWFDVTANLNAFAGQTITLEITSSHTNLYRSWVHVDDVQWSVVAGTLGSPQAFGANGTAPLAAEVGSNLVLTAVVDAQPTTMVADILDETNAVVASGIPLFDDGSNGGDPVAGDGQWTNDGSDPGNPTLTIPMGATVGAYWKTVYYALDGSGSLVSPTDGLVHIPGQGSAETQANFFTIDEQVFPITQAVVVPPASGNKQLYLTTTDDLSRNPPAAQDNQRIRRNRSHDWVLTPALQQDLIISGGTTFVPVRLMISRPNSGHPNLSTDIDIRLSGIGSLNNQTIIVGGSVQEYNFLVPLSATAPVTLGAGTTPVLTISTSNRAIRVYTIFGGTPSRILLDVDTVINVDSVAFYNAAYPAGTMITEARPGDTVFVRATISDPFGSFDITAADVEITDPSGSSNHAMTEVQDDGAASKIYEYVLSLPPIGSDGTWTATVTAAEGTEGTITHQGVASLLVGAPLLTVLKSSNRTTAAPGDLITYTVQVVNTGTATAVNIELDDAMSPYTALRIAYGGSDPLPFRLVSAPAGLNLGTPVYSDDGGATYGYGPLVSGGGGAPAGYDANVSHWQLPMTGFLAGNGQGFTVRYQVIVK